MLLSLAFRVTPLLAIAGRALVLRGYWPQLRQSLTPLEREERPRGVVLSNLAGFSFPGLLGLAAFDAFVPLDLSLPVYHMFVSFLFYFAAMNLQEYKLRRWHDELGMALVDAANLSLMLSVAAIVLVVGHDVRFGVFILSMTALVWGADYLIRLHLAVRRFRSLAAPAPAQPPLRLMVG